MNFGQLFVTHGHIDKPLQGEQLNVWVIFSDLEDDALLDTCSYGYVNNLRTESALSNLGEEFIKVHLSFFPSPPVCLVFCIAHIDQVLQSNVSRSLLCEGKTGKK